MVVYVVVGVVVLVVLIAAYRALGGSAVREEDGAALLDRASVVVTGIVDDVEPLAADAVTMLSGRPDAERAHAVRRRAEGAAQLLERIDPQSLSRHRFDAHALLNVAARELSWSARLLESADCAGAPGMQAAAAALASHARRCSDDARALLERSAPAEERDRAPQPLVE